MSERNSCDVATVSTNTFYGKPKLRDSLRLEKLQFEKTTLLHTYPYKLLNVNSPSTTWRIFRKQNQALEFAKEKMNGVMTFVFHHGLNGERLFLVAHPLMFWHYDSARKENRCSYEIIPESCACKLYFDLEFNIELNPQHDGCRMTDLFIMLISFFVKNRWNIVLNREHVLDLDSTTDSKFSRHLIFQLPNAVFKDNYSVGNFVKMICRDLSVKIGDSFWGLNDYGLNQDDINQLYILNSKGERKLFCDEGVYTKNRHFRLYCSSKWGKNSPLVLSKENKFCPQECKCKFNVENLDEDTTVFLNSLITYLGNDVDSIKVLEYGNSGIQTSVKFQNTKSIHENCDDGPSPYPEIDAFIKGIVAPGRIYRWFHFASGNCVVYSIVGYRYCNNIGREHRSNNIKLVVSLNEMCYYQKCYDPECSTYRSNAIKLPEDLYVLLENNTQKKNDELSRTSMGYFGLPEEEFVDILDLLENEDRFMDTAVGETPTNSCGFPDYGVSDSTLLNVLDTLDCHAE